MGRVDLISLVSGRIEEKKSVERVGFKQDLIVEGRCDQSSVLYTSLYNKKNTNKLVSSIIYAIGSWTMFGSIGVGGPIGPYREPATPRVS